MMTEEQIKKAAYKLCGLRGVDPEEQVPDNSDNPYGFDTCCTCVRWVLVAEEIKRFDMISQAIKEVSGGFGARNEPNFEPEGGLDGFES